MTMHLVLWTFCIIVRYPIVTAGMERNQCIDTTTLVLTSLYAAITSNITFREQDALITYTESQKRHLYLRHMLHKEGNATCIIN